MSKKGKIVEWVLRSLPMMTAGCLLSFAATAETTVAEDLEKCTMLQDRDTRLACYDEVADRKSEAEPSTSTVAETDTEVEQASAEAASATAAAAEVATTQSANDERLATLGEEQLPQHMDNSEKLELQARIVNCKKNSSGRYFFYFENGQVWKQKSDRRLTYRECDFNITITRDFFGYKMQPEGESKRIRISRVR